MKVIFHLNETDRFDHTYGNFHNLHKFPVKDQILLINGDAIKLVQTHINRLEKLSELGVRVLLCANSLRAFEIDATMLPSFCEVVDAGVYTLIEYQQKGYAYIKP